MGVSPRTFGAIKNYEVAEDGTLVLDVLGVVFSDPSKDEDEVERDLQGQYFLPPDMTDYHIGEDESNWLYPGKRVPVLYDHGLDEHVGDVVLGEATFKGVTAEGLEFLIEITERRAKKYRQFVEELVKRGLLGVSSQTVVSMLRATKSGKITGWGIAELSLTPTPADPRTIANVRTVAKNLGVYIGEEDMAKKTNNSTAETAEEAVKAANEQVNTPQEEPREGGAVTKHVEEALERVTTEVEEIQNNAAYAELLKRLNGLEELVQGLTNTVDELVQAQKDADAKTEQHMKTLTNDIGQALAMFAEKFGTVLTKHMATEVIGRAAEMSNVEAAAVGDVSVTKRSRVMDWPGSNTYNGRVIK